jgi:hypothetical protein
LVWHHGSLFFCLGLGLFCNRFLVRWSTTCTYLTIVDRIPLVMCVCLYIYICLMWVSWTLSKVMVFSWQTLLTRIHTKSNLLARGVPLSGRSPNCVLCRDCVESENHLLLGCSLAWAIWVEVWCFGVVEVLPGKIWVLLGSFLSSLNWGKKVYKGILMIWHVVVWALWWTMNVKIFSKKEPVLCVVFDRIKHILKNGCFWRKIILLICLTNDMLISLTI